GKKNPFHVIALSSLRSPRPDLVQPERPQVVLALVRADPDVHGLHAGWQVEEDAVPSGGERIAFVPRDIDREGRAAPFEMESPAARRERQVLESGWNIGLH